MYYLIILTLGSPYRIMMDPWRASAKWSAKKRADLCAPPPLILEAPSIIFSKFETKQSNSPLYPQANLMSFKRMGKDDWALNISRAIIFPDPTSFNFSSGKEMSTYMLTSCSQYRTLQFTFPYGIERRLPEQHGHRKVFDKSISSKWLHTLVSKPRMSLTKHKKRTK